MERKTYHIREAIRGQQIRFYMDLPDRTLLRLCNELSVWKHGWCEKEGRPLWYLHAEVHRRANLPRVPGENYFKAFDNAWMIIFSKNPHLGLRS